MKSRIATLLAAAALGACGGSTATQEAAGTGARPDQQVLRFTAIPDQNTTELEEKFRPFAEHLTSALGVRVEYLPARDYQAAVEMFINGDAGLAWYGGLTGVQAREKVPGAHAVAQGAADPEYYSYFIAHRDTGLERSDTLPANLGSYSFTFGPEQSTSGRLMPEYFLRQATGSAPGELFKNPVGFSRSHDHTAELVASGQYQVGVMNYKVYDQLVARKQLDPDRVRIIWQTPTFADYNWTVRPDLDELYGRGFTARLTRALLEISDPALLAALPRERLVPASNRDYEDIRAVARELDMLR